MKQNQAPFKVYETGPIAVNTILLPLGGTLYIIDPGGSSAMLAAEAEKYGCAKRVILLTHAHCDHIAGVGELAGKLGIREVYLHPDDCELYADPSNSLGPVLRHPDDLPDTVWPLNDPLIEIRHCPGHSPGGVAYYVPSLKTVFAGDTIFEESIGRTDLWGGSARQLEKTIREQIYTLSDDTVIVPGHGPFTEVGHEKRFNAFVRPES